MLTRTYRLRFLTPAFLGNAEQEAQWRTPPIKALLRQWWRVAYAGGLSGTIDVSKMRRDEGLLFGVAADANGGSMQSRLRIRLQRWDTGTLKDWSGLDSGRVNHPEVKNREGKLAPVGAQLYLGYGPLNFAQGQTALKAKAAIQAGEEADLSLAYPAGASAARLDQALELLHRYGTLGGRSRNGWGSFSLRPLDERTPSLEAALEGGLVRPWRDALALDWPHAIGRDESGPLIWQTEPCADWKAAMRRLAELKIGLRTQFVFTSGKNAGQPEERHWLSYPVTNHPVASWGNNARLPNSLRLKVRAASDGKLRGVIIHVPCLPPPAFRPDRRAIADVWRRVHEYLDLPAQRLQRIPA